MDWDEPKSVANQTAAFGELLERLSVDELYTRVTALKGEIARVEKEIEKRQAHNKEADQFFKS